MRMTNKKVFITGIAGFIGFHLARHLKAQGHKVLGCDNFNAYYDPALKEARASILAKEGIEVIRADICDRATMQTTIESFDASHLVHLAAQAGVRYSLECPESYVQSNLVGFVELLEICKTRPHMHFVFASSSSVYGLNTKIPFSETDPTDLPSNLYGASKKSGEMLAFSYHHLYQIPMRGLRFFTVYGPWGRPDMAYFSFTKALLAGDPITVFHEGKMERDFTYVDDIVQGIVAAIDLNKPWDIFNLGNHRPESVNTLISLLETKLDVTAVQQHKPRRPEEVVTTYADIAKAQSMLKFEPKTSLDAGLDLFLDWYLSYYPQERQMLRAGR